MPFGTLRIAKTLDCLDHCISSTNPKMYDDISAGEFLNERLIEIGLVKGK